MILSILLPSCKASALLQRSGVISLGVLIHILHAVLSLSLLGTVAFETEVELIYHCHVDANIQVKRVEGN